MKTKLIKSLLDTLVVKMLENNGEKVDYTDKELEDITIIRTEVMLAKTYDYHKDKVTDEQMLQLATELGKSTRQTIKLFTGVDMHKV